MMKTSDIGPASRYTHTDTLSNLLNQALDGGVNYSFPIIQSSRTTRECSIIYQAYDLDMIIMAKQFIISHWHYHGKMCETLTFSPTLEGKPGF